MNMITEILTEVRPCDSCEHSQRCADKKEACHAFMEYVTSGSPSVHLSRDPSNYWYRKLFSDSEVVFTEGRKKAYREARNIKYRIRPGKKVLVFFYDKKIQAHNRDSKKALELLKKRADIIGCYDDKATMGNIAEDIIFALGVE